ncbi:MFS transporter [Aspergillus vadensis CBS 113365]|uniref:MFS transporter n=1 Tax=Aspergillus vadensis (strain CBS 113365 / IMI 142717 / IBT 24658) TaxID=1448311 RepID=A0A319AXB2_ASPVC|nr:MFS transporter [Aspergillus vadensis CBS 113365]PYH64927.1 MFS transporter [Aspergillus vadensis CBS 113365]
MEHKSVEHAEFVSSSKACLEPNRLTPARIMTPEQFALAERKLKKKLDVRLLLCVWIIFVMNYLDRNNISAAKIAGIESSLGLSSTHYATAVALLFAGYVLMQIPSNIFLANLHPSLYIPSVMVIWGMLSALVGVVHKAAGLYALRLLLGFVEAAFYPGALFLISSWYKRSEMGVRSAFLFSGSQLGSAFSGLIGAGITSGLDRARELESWRWIFIIEGSATIFIALMAFFVLPNYPSNTPWLTQEERAVAEWRLIADAGQVNKDDKRWSYGFQMAFSDWRLYAFALIFLCIQVASATSNFFPAVVKTLGFSMVNTLLLTVPPYMVALAISIANNWSANQLRNSSFHAIWPLSVAIAGFIIAAATLNTGARIKRASVVAFVNAFGNLSQIFSSYFYPDSSAPQYVTAMAANSAFSLGAIVLAIFMRFVLLRANRRIERGESTVAEEMKGQSQREIAGVSDEERIARREGFRYIA